MDRSDHLEFEDEGAGYLVSVSDIMAGLLFIFIITLVSFVIHYQQASDRITNNKKVRDELLTRIEYQLTERGLQVKIDKELGVLRLTEQAVRFDSNRWDLEEQAVMNLNVIAEVLSELLPCYAISDEYPDQCDRENVGKLEAVFIEGHTDNVPVSKRFGYTNWELSTNRAITTYKHLMGHRQSLGSLFNTHKEPLFSVAGYAEQRPVIRYDRTRPEPANRRIDLRFIMTPPSTDQPKIIEEIHRKGVS